MHSIAHTTSATPAPTPHPVDSVAATAGGFLRALGLDRAELALPWITITVLSTGAWIDVSPPYGTPAERLDLISEAAELLGADTGGVRYLPTGATLSNVEVTGEWAECPITVRTSISTSDLVDIETDKAVAATTGDELENWLAAERRHEAADDEMCDRAAEAHGDTL